MNNYSALQLTYQSDRLLALSAITKKMEKLRVDDMYIAGLWKQTLLQDLSWYRTPNSGPRLLDILHGRGFVYPQQCPGAPKKLIEEL